MIFFSDFAGDTLAFVAVVETTGTISTTAFNQQATWPENGIGSLQFFPYGHGEVARCAAVKSHLLFQKVQIHH